MAFNSDLDNPDTLENFDFEKFLQTTEGDFNLDPPTIHSNDSESLIHFEGRMAEDKRGINHEYLLDGYEKQLADHIAKYDGNSVNKRGNTADHEKSYEELGNRIVKMPSTRGNVGDEPAHVVDDDRMILDHVIEEDIDETTEEGIIALSLREDRRPVAACQQCRSAHIRCDGKLPACTPCGKAMQSAECSFSDPSFMSSEMREYESVSPTKKPEQQIPVVSPSLRPRKRCRPRKKASSPDVRYSKPQSDAQVAFSEREQEDSESANMEVVDRLVSLWTTVKPL